MRLPRVPPLLSLLLVGACGGDDGSSTSSTQGGTASTATSAGTSDASSGGAGSTGATGGTGASSGGASSGGASSGTASGTTGGCLTWNGFAQQFFETYCWACHGAGDPEGRDFSTLAGVMAESSVIACGVAPTKLQGCPDFPPPAQFPVGNGPKPSDQERLDLVAWIEAGLPEG